MEWTFTGELFHWRGPAPFHFITVSPEAASDLREAASWLTYGWGVIPVTAQIGDTSWSTSLFPRDGSYVLPVKVAVRRAEGVEEGDVVAVTMATVEQDPSP